ncbi:MAG: hypothetical protein AAGA68_22755 [Pseudomonadota bacterium]
MLSSSNAERFTNTDGDGNVWLVRLRPDNQAVSSLRLSDRTNGARIRAEVEVYFPNNDNTQLPIFYYSEVVGTTDTDNTCVNNEVILQDFSLRRTTVGSAQLNAI